MNFLDILYTLTIGPLKLLFEVIFACANIVLNNPGLSIICLSFALNIILLPLYMRAEKIQKKENDIQLSLQPGVDHIKKVFKGDEQYMILQTYYRQNNYKPIYALRSLTSLLLQIPFFLAASGFLSNLSLLNGTSFFFIKDLGKPDGLLFGLNLLPIAMTLINLFNCVVYTKGQPFKSKIQLYLMALVFLILLYNSPAGLSFYYLLNNVFSLIKNVFLKIHNKKKALGLLLIIGSLGFLLVTFLLSNFSTKLLIIISLGLLLLFILGIVLFFNIKIPKNSFGNVGINKNSFLLSTIFLCLLMGLFIPSKVIDTSPEEFIDMSYYVNPVEYIIYSFSLAFGTFIIWFNIYYSLMKDNVKKIMSILMCAICFICIVNYMFFGTNLGTISNILIYDNGFNISSLESAVNILISIVIVVAVIVIYKKKYQIIKYLTVSICCVFIVMSAINVNDINKTAKEVCERNINNNVINNIPDIKFSKNGKNVVVLMLDRAISSYFPYILEEKTELKEQFAGFTYYPNTISFGGHTNFSVPSLFGGYEYTPVELNRRNDELLQDKHNEALLVMPRLFSDNGYKVTVFDPPYAGYKEIPDLSIYDDYSNVDAYITKNLFFKNELLCKLLKRNLFCFSFTKCSPSVLQYILYNNGSYLQTEQGDYGISLNFEKDFSVLQNMATMTKIVNDDSNNVLLMQNSCTHNNVVIDDNITNYGSTAGLNITSYQQLSHYYVNIKSLLELGRWFDYLKNNDVYNNTRIIICSDHSFSLNLNEELVLGEEQDEDLMLYNPLLLVKDFNSTEYNVDESFMTLADILYLTTKDIINNPTNPFTNNSIVEINKDEDLYIIGSNKHSIEENNGTTFLPSKWYKVHNDCRNINNWRLIENIDK